MTFSWADEVIEAVEKDILPEFATAPKKEAATAPSKTAVTAAQKTAPKSVVPDVVRSTEKTTTNQRDPDWKNQKSWRATAEPAPKVVAPAQSTTSSGTINSPDTTSSPDTTTSPGTITACSPCSTSSLGTTNSSGTIPAYSPDGDNEDVASCKSDNSSYYTASTGTMSAYHTPLASPLPSPPVSDDSTELVENIEGMIRSKLNQSFNANENFEDVIRRRLTESSKGKEKCYDNSRDGELGMWAGKLLANSKKNVAQEGEDEENVGPSAPRAVPLVAVPKLEHIRKKSNSQSQASRS